MTQSYRLSGDNGLHSEEMCECGPFVIPGVPVVVIHKPFDTKGQTWVTL